MSGERPPAPDAEERFRARVAWACLVDGLTQGEAADRLGVTRLRVNRALSEARRSGMVRVILSTAFTACLALEERLKARFGLRAAYVAPAPPDPAAVQATVGAALGHLLSERLADPAVRLFGMSWGATLNIATRHMAPLDRPDLEIVSVMGGLSRGSDLDSFDVTRRLAKLCGARRRYLIAPLYAGSAESRATVMALDVFAEVLDMIRRADAIAMAAGDMSDRSLLMRDALPPDIRREALIEAGGVGDVLGTVLDAAGRPIDHPINGRVIGIGLDDLRRIPDVILAAGGAHKAAIVRAVLRAGVVGTLVTDEATAARALEDAA
jgi:DNA-binding transcriptional regulator LsrR (DeoR family)